MFLLLKHDKMVHNSEKQFLLFKYPVTIEVNDRRRERDTNT